MEKSIKSLLIEELQDLLSCEIQIVKALPKMVEAAESSELKKAFSEHWRETKKQVTRLEKVFRLLKREKRVKFCMGAKGLIDECKEVLKDHKRKSLLRDAALIAKAQRIEHYEISAYGTARCLAKELHLHEIADLLQETLNEESKADSKLNKIAKGWVFNPGINHRANIHALKPTKLQHFQKLIRAA